MKCECGMEWNEDKWGDKCPMCNQRPTNPSLLGVRVCLLIVAMLVASGCTEAERAESRKRHDESERMRTEAVLVRTAPDGTKLWKTCDTSDGQTVYFSTAGAQWETTRTQGKGAKHEKRNTPNSKP